jgi:hypothetical protein
MNDYRTIRMLPIQITWLLIQSIDIILSNSSTSFRIISNWKLVYLDYVKLWYVYHDCVVFLIVMLISINSILDSIEFDRFVDDCDITNIILCPHAYLSNKERWWLEQLYHYLIYLSMLILFRSISMMTYTSID